MLPNSKIFNLQHQRFWLLSQKAMYWQKHKILIVADLHIGKSAHFRKHGIAVSGQVNESNLNKLSGILEKTAAEQLIILGDLFHSDINKEWEQFIKWRKNYKELEVNLVIGNHDILKRKNYHSGVINLFKKLTLNPFLFIHDINEHRDNVSGDKYILSGHVHPAVKLKGQGRQTIKLPCFFFGTDHGILPAFGNFTGTHTIQPTASDRVFIIADSNIVSANKLKS